MKMMQNDWESQVSAMQKERGHDLRIYYRSQLNCPAIVCQLLKSLNFLLPPHPFHPAQRVSCNLLSVVIFRHERVRIRSPLTPVDSLKL